MVGRRFGGLFGNTGRTDHLDTARTQSHTTIQTSTKPELNPTSLRRLLNPPTLWRWTRRGAFAIVAVLGLYVVGALVLGLIPINRDYSPADAGVPIYLATNGVHADILVPANTETVDWREEYPSRLFPNVDPRQDYIAFGWGDRGFYLNTERWADLTAQTAAVAVLGLGRPAMHIEYSTQPRPGPHVVALRISQQHYRDLVNFIREYAERDARGQVVVIGGRHYGRSDAFFEAKGTYSALMTSNEWARRALYVAGVRVPVWAPLDTPLFFHLRDGAATPKR